jgi:fatty acyl-CoA reductase
VKVYHVATSTLNPLNFYDFMGIVSRHFVSSPLTDRRSGKTIITDKNIKVFTSRFAFEFDTWFRQGGMSVSFTWFLEKIKLKSVSPVTKRRNASMRRIFNELRSMGKIYLPYTTYKARFLSENVKALSTSLSEEDREAFPIELETLNWENYLRTAHIPGLLRHALKRYS